MWNKVIVSLLGLRESTEENHRRLCEYYLTLSKEHRPRGILVANVWLKWMREKLGPETEIWAGCFLPRGDVNSRLLRDGIQNSFLDGASVAVAMTRSSRFIETAGGACVWTKALDATRHSVQNNHLRNALQRSTFPVCLVGAFDEFEPRATRTRDDWLMALTELYGWSTWLHARQLDQKEVMLMVGSSMGTFHPELMRLSQIREALGPETPLVVHDKSGNLGVMLLTLNMAGDNSLVVSPALKCFPNVFP